MTQKDTGTNMNLKLPEDTYAIVFNRALDMSKDKKRKVTLKEAAINIINEYGNKSNAAKS